MSKKKNTEIKWFDSGNIITSFIIGIIALIIICSQSFAVSSNNTFQMFGSVINHNSIYLLVVVYFIILKTNFGKRYFNYCNLLLIFLYLLTTITSFLTLIQSFSLNTVLLFVINFVLIIYLFHTMFRDTRIWKEFKLGKSPFNELSNDWYFYTLIFLSLFLLSVNLISTIVIGGVVISILDTIYIIFFGRYIYLYREFLDYYKKDINNTGNFDNIKESIKNTVEDVTEKVNDFCEDNKIDEKFDKLKDNVKNTMEDVTEKISDFIEENKIDEKMNDLKNKVVDSSNDILKKVDKIKDNKSSNNHNNKSNKSNKNSKSNKSNNIKNNNNKKKGDNK